MKLKLFFISILLSLTSLAKSQGVYDVSNIPAELLIRSDAIVRTEEYNLQIRSRSNAIMQFKRAVTILSRSGDNHAVMRQYYDKFSSLSNLKASLYDAKGNKLKSYKLSDFKDNSITSEGTLYDDNRTKSLDFSSTTYPYTIEYSFEKNYDGYLSFKDWCPIQHYSLGLEHAEFTLQIPRELKFRYLKNQLVKTDSSEINNKMVYRWACNNISSVAYEPMTTGMKNLVPWVMAAPDHFEYDHSKGNLDSWRNLGTWIYENSTNRQNLPEAAIERVKALIAHAQTDREKISILYRYLQSSTRYVGIQLGIGGFIPMTAEKVATVNYGDCKALSNYMKAMLAVAGIESHLVMLGSDMPSLNPDYSSFGQANHMVLCVPAAKDTTWLECTSQYLPAGFLGKSTASKIVLLVTAEGGKLVKTPTYKPEDNYQNRFTSVTLTPEGSAEINIHTDYGACQYEENLGITLLEPVEQRKNLMNSLDIPHMEILSARFTQPDKDLPRIEENLSLKGSQLLSHGGDKLFLTLNMLNRQESVPAKIENRKTEFALPYGFKDMDEITYTLPDGYKVEFVPKDVSLESEFGRYTAKSVLKGNKIVYTRMQMINSKKFPAIKYSDLMDFYKKIYLADKQKAVLAKIN